MTDSSQVLRPQYLFDGDVLHRGAKVVLDGDRITDVVIDGEDDRAATWPVVLMPGFVNAHSHAFQRGLRGRGETFEAGAGSFFTWRQAMYGLVERLDVDLGYELSRMAFEEMLDAGFTSVGEFHYVHHADGRPWALDDAVIRAAADAGIRLVLLYADYVRGGFDNEPLEGGQRSFDTGSPEAFLERLDRVGEMLDGSTQSLGVVSHSTRAVPIDRIVTMREAARERNLVFHIHLEEVRREIEACRTSHGCTPMRLLLDHGVVDQHTTAVHCTHSTPEDLAEFGAAGGIACLCPLTEGNLGDGIADLAAVRSAGCRIAIGSDLNSRISPVEELRWLEYAQRLNCEMRGGLTDESGRTGRALLRIGTREGAESLGLDAGVLRSGAVADFVAIDLEHPTLAGVDQADLLEAIVLGTGTEAIAGSCVGGRWLRGGPPEEE